MIPLPVFYALLLLFLLFVTFYIYKEYVRAEHNGAYFLPTKNIQVITLIDFLNTYTKENNIDKNKLKIVDLGSGTGTILMKLAQSGFSVDGLEINKLLYVINYIKLLLSSFKTRNNVNLYVKNFWNENLGKYNVVILYGIGYMLNDMQTKLTKELKKGSVVVSVRFSLPVIALLEKKDDVYFYTV